MLQGTKGVGRVLLALSLVVPSVLSACADDDEGSASPGGGAAGAAGAGDDAGDGPVTKAGAPNGGEASAGVGSGGAPGSAGAAKGGAPTDAGAAGMDTAGGAGGAAWAPGSELVVPPGSEIAGKTQAELAADWWAWIFGAAASTNPLLDETGDDCAVDQPSGVFFLAGNFGGTSVRSCTLPASTPIFFPLINGEADNCNIEEQSQASAEEMQAYLDGVMATPTDFEVELDGELLVDGLEDGLHYAVGQEEFAYEVPEDDSMAHYFVVNYGSPYIEFSGTCTPAISNGYYVGLQGLSAGTHLLRFRGKASDGFSLNVIYQLTVSP